MAKTSDCQTSLGALATGRLRDYTGIDGCTRADAERVLGATTGPDALGGTLGPHRAYAVQPGAPHGLTVFFDGDRVTAVQILQPVLVEPAERALGTPEATAPSKLEPFHSQHIYAGRGVTLHADDSTHKVMWLFAYHTSTVDQYLASPLAKLAIRDEPLD